MNTMRILTKNYKIQRTQLKNTIIEILKALEEINSILDGIEEWIRELRTEYWKSP